MLPITSKAKILSVVHGTRNQRNKLVAFFSLFPYCHWPHTVAKASMWCG